MSSLWISCLKSAYTDLLETFLRSQRSLQTGVVVCEFAFLGRLLAFCETTSDWKQPLMFLCGRPGVSTWVVQLRQLRLSNIAAPAIRSLVIRSESSYVVFNCVKYLIDSVSAICSV
ncbi:hypothetical protein Y032_0148g2660 [Ancylostoma ceylanicum]|uniref:Uncharacterized protein n=1 Tax=Ancylostoma ceylanicum TaxID=53326 RepID=A0A016T1W3_9BILA|nr:hypothetical protein Y032_0148g2660 [Ancylostoma ceylanicum]